MNHLRFALLSSSAAFALAAFACGGISDPTRGEGRVATVSGALTGIAVPANARVALVYRKITPTSTGSQSSVEVGSDVAVVGGKFTMNLGVPAADYFSSPEGSSFNNGGSAPPTVRADAPTSDTGTPPSAGTSTSGAPGAFGTSTKLAPRDLVGGSITQPLSAALAGFVVYADTNGNGKLDLEGQYASSPDEILGGNAELMLVYLKGGGSLDYEKLRDKSGILPASGFNLMWSEGRWLPLNDVELKLTPTAKLPSGVCYSSYGYATGGSSGSSDSPNVIPPKDPASSGSGSSGSSGPSPSPGSYYPSPGAEGLVCSPDGRGFQYNPPYTCPPSPPQPIGLCAGDVYETSACGGRPGWGESLAPGAAVPAAWPCPVANGVDGGSADAAVDAGSADGG